MHPELGSADLREHGGESLTDRRRTRKHRHLPRPADPHQAQLVWPAPGALQSVPEPYADVAALRARLHLAACKRVPSRVRQQLRLRRDIVAAVVCDRCARAALERALIRHLLRRDQIAPPHFGAIELELPCHAIHQPLDGERRLRIARAAHRRHRRLVGVRDHRLHGQRGDVIRTWNGRRGIVRQVDVLQRISALVVEQLAAHRENARVLVDRDLEGPILIALLDSGDEMLAPVLDPFQRPFQELRRGRDRDIFRIDAKLGAEAAADIGRRHAQPILVDDEIGAQVLVEIVRFLGRSPHRDAAARRLVLRDEPARLDRMTRSPMLKQLLAIDMRRGPERGVGIAIGHAMRGDDVRGQIAPGCARAGERGIAGIDHRGKDFVIHVDQRDGILGDIAVPRDYERDWLADKRNLARAERIGPQRLARLSALRGLAHHAPPRQHGREIIQRKHGMHAVERARRR